MSSTSSAIEGTAYSCPKPIKLAKAGQDQNNRELCALLSIIRRSTASFEVVVEGVIYLGQPSRLVCLTNCVFRVSDR